MKGFKFLLIALFFLVIFSSAAFALQPGDLAPTFSLRDSQGRSFHLSHQVGPHKKAGTRGLILNFFASIASPAAMSSPS